MDFLILALTAAGATMAIDHYADDTIHSQTEAPVVNEQLLLPIIALRLLIGQMPKPIIQVQPIA